MKDTDIALQDMPDDGDTELDDTRIRDYLEQHPNFFQRNQELLISLKLPHESGKAISLMERQVDLLRRRTREAEGRLNDLVAVARDNEQLFEKTRALTLALLDAESLDELSQILEERFRDDFQTDAGGLILLVEEEGESTGNTRTLTRSLLREALPRFEDIREATGGALREQEIDALFPLHDRRIQSAMVAPVFLAGDAAEAAPRALLALGSNDRAYFHDRLGTSFLEYIREVLGRILEKHLTGQD